MFVSLSKMVCGNEIVLILIRQNSAENMEFVIVRP